jgi:O-antigen ligase
LGFTKGAVSAFVIVMFILIFSSLMFYLFSSGKKNFKKIAFLLATLLVLGTLGFFQLDFTQERIDKLWQSASVQSRLIIWHMGWQAWQERFWLGWGLENFNIPFTKYYNPELPLTGDVWYDRVHNIVLDTGVSSGIVGLLSYLSIFGVAIFGLLKLLPKVSDRKNIIIPLGMAALFVVYFLQNIWVFDMISSYMMFFLTLAFVGFLISPQDEEEESRQKVVPLPSFVGALLIILTIFTFFLGNIQSARASRFILKGIAYPLEQSIPAFQKAFQASPMAKFEAPEQFSTKISSLAVQADQNKELLSQGFKLAEEEFKNAILQNPLDFRLYLFLGRHYNNFYQFSGDEEKLVLAEEILKKALELSPTNQQVYFIFAQTRFLQGQQEKALELLQKAKDLEPRFAGSGWYLLRGYRMTGKYELALSELKELENLGFDWQGNAETLKEGIEILKETGEDINLLIPLYEKGIELDPQDLYLWEDLINAYINTGKREKAKEAAEKFLEIKPEFAPQVEQLLKELGY